MIYDSEGNRESLQNILTFLAHFNKRFSIERPVTKDSRHPVTVCELAPSENGDDTYPILSYTEVTRMPTLAGETLRKSKKILVHKLPSC